MRSRRRRRNRPWPPHAAAIAAAAAARVRGRDISVCVIKLNADVCVSSNARFFLILTGRLRKDWSECQNRPLHF
ncbi:hypothetical protein L596_019364 [Steinernema carpocapsae]|uniref:Uncharacterized protein n=1 Tax=Steinernema carpocapsae TaxID=34508 RepID=A0A4U5MQH6_STECR|nr:hypothetical protein L596_019364 [Steinernema carpocapsae]